MSFGKGRALVTGGAGLIGSHLVDLLIEKGYEVTILDNLEGQTHLKGCPAWVNRQAHFIHGDVRNDTDLLEALRGVNFVFHQAAFGGFTEQTSKYVDTNVNGTARIFEVIERERLTIQKVVVASSQAVYGEGAYQCKQDGIQFPSVRSSLRLERKLWGVLCPKCGAGLSASLTPEEKSAAGHTPYALSKEFEERLALSCGERLGIPVVALRYAVTYGPRQSLFNPYTGVVSIFSTRLLNELAPLVYEDGDQTRDFVYVEDVARANLFVMEDERADGQVFNVATGSPVTIKELARMLASLYGKSIEPDIPGEFRHGDVRHIVLDPAKLKRWGFFTTTPLRKGLDQFVEWIKEQGPIEEYFTHAYQNLKRRRIIAGS